MSDLTGVQIKEKPAWVKGPLAGTGAIVAGILSALVGVGLIITAVANTFNGGGLLSIILALVCILVSVASFTMVSVLEPGEAVVTQFFGEYMGTVRRTGLVATLPFLNKNKLSVRDINFETPVSKVNDANGNPINISAIVVWRLNDTAKGTYAVEDYVKYLYTQAEAAVRHVASQHPYDGANMTGDGENQVATLLNGSDTVNKELLEEIQDRAAATGVEIIEVRINNLAYSVEIAQAMLQRQQASAIVDAREIIVKGALGIVEDTVEKLSSDAAISKAEKTRLISNLLVVLVGESKVTPTMDMTSSQVAR